MAAVTVTIDGHAFPAELNESETAAQILAALPLAASTTKWGDEFYFRIPVTLAEAEDACDKVAVGTLAYWPPGNAFCIFFGPTPVSRGSEPRAYSPVNVFGRLLGDLTPLRGMGSGVSIRVSK